jgi:hypothetical protein
MAFRAASLVADTPPQPVSTVSAGAALVLLGYEGGKGAVFCQR